MMSCNPRMAEMFGYTQAEMTGLPCRRGFPLARNVPPASASRPARCCGDGMPFERAEFQFRRRDGSLFWCRVRAKAVDPERRGGGHHLDPRRRHRGAPDAGRSARRS